MLRTARSATADYVRILLQQLLFFHRMKLAAMRLRIQFEETMDDLDDICRGPLSQPCFEHFFGPVLRAMMKQVCWHSRRSEAHRGLPEAGLGRKT